MDVVVVGLARDNAATKQKPNGGGTVMRGQQTRPERLLRSSSSDRPSVRRWGDKPASESPAATREQVVRFRQFVAPRRRPADQPGPFELQQRPERVRPVGHQLRFMAMGQRDNRRAQPDRPESEAQHGERLWVQPGSEAANVLAHDRERKRAETARGWWPGLS